MSTIGGYFDETLLNAIRVKADELSFDDRVKQQFNPNYDVLKAIQAVQTAQISNVFRSKKSGHGGDKCTTVDVIWQQFCDIEASNQDEDCEFCGHETSTNKDTHTLTYEGWVPFSVDEYDFCDNEFDYKEAIAKAMLKADVELINNFAAYAVSVINANLGWNVYTGGKGVVAGAATYILPAYWDSALVAYFNKVATLNKFTSPVLLSGANLYEPVLISKANSGNEGKRGDAVLFNMFPIYFDLFNVDTVNDPDLITYMLSMGSLAIANTAHNPPSPEVVNPVFTRWQEASRFMPQLTYDVWYKPECSTHDKVKHCFKYKLTGDVLVNPTGCDDHNTGLLQFVCGTEPD